MRRAVLLGLLGCSGGSSPAVDAASIDGAIEDDAAPPCVTRVPFAASQVTSIGLDGATVLVAAFEGLFAVPLDGSAPAMLVSAPAPVGSYAKQAFYATAVAPGIEVRAGDGSVLATIAATTPQSVLVNATDVYVLATDATETRLWRVPRVANAQAAPIATVPAGARDLALGTTLAAFNSAGVIHTVPVPDGGTPTSRGMGGSISLVGDAGFTATRRILTSHAYELKLDRFLPTAKSLVSTTLFSADHTLFSDGRYLYLGIYSDPTSPNPQAATMTAYEPDTLITHSAATCTDFRPSGPVVYDATQLYGVVAMGLSASAILIAPRAP